MQAILESSNVFHMITHSFFPPCCWLDRQVWTKVKFGQRPGILSFEILLKFAVFSTLYQAQHSICFFPNQFFCESLHVFLFLGQKPESRLWTTLPKCQLCNFCSWFVSGFFSGSGLGLNLFTVLFFLAIAFLHNSICLSCLFFWLMHTSLCQALRTGGRRA